MSPVFFEAVRQMAGMFVLQTIRRFFDGIALLQQFDGLLLSLFGKPSLGAFANMF